MIDEEVRLSNGETLHAFGTCRVCDAASAARCSGAELVHRGGYRDAAVRVVPRRPSWWVRAAVRVAAWWARLERRVADVLEAILDDTDPHA